MNKKLQILLDDFKNGVNQHSLIINKTTNSWTNEVYELVTKENLVYFIRIKKHFQNKLELNLMENFFKYDFFFDKNSSDMISQALINFDLKITQKFMDFLVNWITSFQNFGKKIKNNTMFLFDEYLHLVRSNTISEIYQKLYKDELKTSNLVLAHNDLSQFNLLKDYKNNYQIIDFEYAAWNLQKWDLFNFMRSLDNKNFIKMQNILIKKFNFDKQTIYKYLFLTTYYAHLWSKNAYQNFSRKSEIKQYTFQTYNLSKKFLNKYLFFSKKINNRRNKWKKH